MNTFLRIAAQCRKLRRLALIFSSALLCLWGCKVVPTKTGVAKVEPMKAVALMASAPNIMVLNSDASIKKYKVAQDEFVKDLGSGRITIVELQLPKWRRLTKVKDMLYDEYPELVYCIGTKAYLLANKYIPKCQIVFSSTINWRRLPRNEHACGVANEFNPAQQISYYHNALPKVKKIGVLYSDKFNKQWFESASTAAKEHGLELIGKKVKSSLQIEKGVDELLDVCDAFWLISDPLVIPEECDVKTIMSACEAKRVPVLTYHKGFKGAGPVMIVSVDEGTVGRQAAGIASDLLKSEFEGDKIQDPVGSFQIFNLKKAKAFNLEFNKEALAIFDEVIEE